ncbi:MAG: hypothetical protein COB08_018130 [Rhodobacteraceae bacterium]|nr:hypothetical protein [Paracoccaceae bacterium]
MSGRFRILTNSGVDIAPKSAKSRGLLALLATTQDLKAERYWLQQMLWSDRGYEQGSSSLRQALMEIRRALGAYAGLLQADRRLVMLNPTHLKIKDPIPATQIFVSGLNIRDPAFTAWLEEARRHRMGSLQARVAQGAAPAILGAHKPVQASVVFCGSRASDPMRAYFEDTFIDNVARSIDETLAIDVYSSLSSEVPKTAFKIYVHSKTSAPDEISLRVVIEESSKRRVWAQTVFVKTRGAAPVEDIGMMAFGNALIEALADYLMMKRQGQEDHWNASFIGRDAIRKIFSMQPQALEEANTLLENAYALDSRGIYLAWRAHLRAIQFVERHSSFEESARLEAEELCHSAMLAAPNNSMVLAAVASARLILNGNVIACSELAQKSIQLNPSNPLAWDSLATAKLYTGENDEAHFCAARAQKLGDSTPYKFWWDMGRCLTSAFIGKRQEALNLAEVSHALSPHFRPPLRYMIGLYAANGEAENALRAVSKLQALEPDFSIDRMVNDMSYPVSQLRRNRLLKKDMLLAIER